MFKTQMTSMNDTLYKFLSAQNELQSFLAIAMVVFKFSAEEVEAFEKEFAPYQNFGFGLF